MKYSIRDISKHALPSLAPEDFFLLLAHATKKTKEYLIAHPEYTVSDKLHKKILSLIERRLDHEPVALITGHREFYQCDFFVTRATLVPRPETEILIDLVLDQIRTIPETKECITIIDVGTGSGNIILSVAKALESSPSTHRFHFFGIDISSEALIVARKNTRTISPKIRPRLIKSDLLKSLPLRSLKQSDRLIILANLPYLSNNLYRHCPPDVKNFEPKSALMSPQQGLGHILRLLQKIAEIRQQYPRITIDIWLEISPEQKPLLKKKVRGFFQKTPFFFYRDLAGKYRFFSLSLQQNKA